MSQRALESPAARLAEEFDIRFVRRPFDIPMNTLRGAVPLIKRAASSVARISAG